MTLRTLADADALIAAAGVARRVAILGSGFIGLETAAAMRERGVEVTMVSPMPVPLAGPLGEDLGRLVMISTSVTECTSAPPKRGMDR